MDFKETGMILAALTTFYTERLMPKINETTIALWAQMLSDLPYPLVQAAINSYVAINKYPPTIADIRERCVQASTPPQESAEQAWSRVFKAIRSCGHTEPYRAERELGDLWQMVGRDWSYYCSLDESQTPNEKARFIRMYSAEQKKTTERLQIPQFVQKALAAGRLLEISDGSEAGQSDD